MRPYGLKTLPLKSDWSVFSAVNMITTMRNKATQNLSPELDAAQAEAPLRQRLAPEVRVLQILDAALVEFSERGFNAARMDDIASRCGLSKGGLYAHFQSKEQIFKALLTRLLAPPQWEDKPPPPATAGPRAFAQWVVDSLYAALGRPASVAAMRLLVAESARVQELVNFWGDAVVQPQVALLGKMLESRMVQGGRLSSVVVRQPWLVIAPVVHTLLAQMIFGHANPEHIASHRQAHIELLTELLEPHWCVAPP